MYRLFNRLYHKTVHDALFMYLGCSTLSHSTSHISAPILNIYKILSVLISSWLALRSSSLSSSPQLNCRAGGPSIKHQRAAIKSHLWSCHIAIQVNICVQKTARGVFRSSDAPLADLFILLAATASASGSSDESHDRSLIWARNWWRQPDHVIDLPASTRVLSRKFADSVVC